MFVCSVSTILFNGNPLLRFDGYYILSDIAEIPNLRQKSTKILSRVASEYCLGIEQPEDPFLPDRHLWFFATYTIAATVYRWVVVFSILVLLERRTRTVRTQSHRPSHWFDGLCLDLLVQPVWNLIKFFRAPGRMSQVKAKNLGITVAIIAAALAFVTLVPLPYNVKCAVEIKPNEQLVKQVIVKTPGLLESVEVELGQTVQSGDVIAKVRDIRLEMEHENIVRNGKVLQHQYDGLREKQRDDKSVTGDIHVLERASESNAKSLYDVERRLNDLVLTAPVSGVIMPAPEKKPDPKVEGRLPTWDGSLLRKENHGARVEMDDVLCMVGDPKAFEAMLVIDQSDMPFIKEGLDARILLDSYTNDELTGTIDAIANSDMEVASQSLGVQTGGQLALVTDAAGVQRPQSASYEARVPFSEELPISLRFGMRGRAKIKAAPQTLLMRLWRLMARTFHFNI